MSINPSSAEEPEHTELDSVATSSGPAIIEVPEETAESMPPAQASYGPLAWFLVFILALIWGTSFILIKRGLEVYAPNELGAIRITLASLFLLPFAVSGFKHIQKSHWKYLIISGLTGNLLPAFLFAFGQTKLNSGLTGVLNSLTSLFTLLIGAMLFQQRITWLKGIGVAVGMAGTAGLIYFSGKVGASENPMYALLIVLATAMYGYNVNNIKTNLQGIPPRAMSSIALLTVGPVAAIYLATTDFVFKLQHTDGSGMALFYIAILAAFSTALGLVLFNKLLHMTTALFASSTTYLMPVFALIWGVADGEPLTWVHFTGMATILGGVYIVSRAK